MLSRNGAVSTAYFMSGDEDVREGVVEAQEFGEACDRATRRVRDSEEVSGIPATRPRIASSVDVWLIKEAASRFGDPLPERTKREVRTGFWKGLETAKSANENEEDVVE